MAELILPQKPPKISSALREEAKRFVGIAWEVHGSGALHHNSTPLSDARQRQFNKTIYRAVGSEIERVLEKQLVFSSATPVHTAQAALEVARKNLAEAIKNESKKLGNAKSETEAEMARNYVLVAAAAAVANEMNELHNQLPTKQKKYGGGQQPVLNVAHEFIRAVEMSADKHSKGDSARELFAGNQVKAAQVLAPSGTLLEKRATPYQKQIRRLLEVVHHL